MPDIILCPSCRKRLQLADEHVGPAVQCPACEAQCVAGSSAPPFLGAPGEGGVEEAVMAVARPVAPVDRDDDDEAEVIGPLWWRLLPAWIGLAVGAFFCVAFLVLGPGR